MYQHVITLQRFNSHSHKDVRMYQHVTTLQRFKSQP